MGHCSTVFAASSSGPARRKGDRRTGRRFFAVFRSPAAAIQAALTVQQKLVRKRWPDAVEVRVRVGLHSGHPVLTPLGYIGLPVHTVARVCSAARGGQILASSDTTAALTEPPTGVQVSRLGRRRLKGLPSAVELQEDFRKPAKGTPRRARLIMGLWVRDLERMRQCTLMILCPETS
jgi:class 3 adenylate cyclase